MMEQPKPSVKLPKVSQLGYAVADIEKACKYYESTLGIGPFCPPFEVDMSGAVFKGKPVQTKIKVAFVQWGDVQIELIQPLDSRNPYTEYLARHGDGIHHLGFTVTDMDVMKAEFANMEGLLWPGQFVDTELVLTIEPNAVTIPASAVVTGQEGTFAFVVGPDNKVAKRLLKVNRTQNNTVIIDDGLRSGETVITDGQMRLVPGALVEIKAVNAAQRRSK